MLAENQEGIPLEGGGILFRLGNVAETARRNGSLAVLYGTLAHEHGFGQVALLAVLVFKGLLAKASEIGNEGHVARRGKAMRTFRGRGAGKEKAQHDCGGAGNEKFVH